MVRHFTLFIWIWCSLSVFAQKNPDVTVKDNGDGTVTMANGIVSIVIVKESSRLNSVKYTYNNGTEKTTEMLLGKRQYYYGGFMLGNGKYKYKLQVDPNSNGGNYAEVKLTSESADNGVMETYFSMLRGSSGYYSTATMTHRKQDKAFEVGAWGIVTRVPKDFNWISADKKRNFYIGDRTTKGIRIPHSPHEITICKDGHNEGEFEDKFIYGQDHCDLKAWGWSSVGPGKLNIGIWMMTNMDFSNGGPLKRDVSVYPYSELNNSILTGEVGQGSDGFLAEGEEWTKTCGPWFVYMNNISKEITDPRQAAEQLYDDALTRADVEKNSWPYKWFKNENYPQANRRGTVSGKIKINDFGNPNASAEGLWVGVQQQPFTIKGYYDFQKWLRTYQYWVKTDKDGKFEIPNVIEGDNYTLWAFGPGASGTFMSQEQTGGKPPFIYNLPKKSFNIKVKGGAVSDLGEVVWTPTRIGPTVFELGIPDRKASEFRHGEDFWAPEKSPKLGYITPIWGGQMYFPLDFPDGMVYNVGKSNWSTDWNYVLPSLPGENGKYKDCSGVINFELAEKPQQNKKAALHLSCAGDNGGHVVVTVNGIDLASVEGAIAYPQPFTKEYHKRTDGSGGFCPPYSDTSSIHFSDHGPFSDQRISFPASILKEGKNTIKITKNAKSLVCFYMVDYLRLELEGFVPPAPKKVTVFSGNNENLVCWSIVPGATSYNLLRSTNPDSGFIPIKTNIQGVVAGSGLSVLTFKDSEAVNNVKYYYCVQSVNPNGRSLNSNKSRGVIPSDKKPIDPPRQPQGITVINASHHNVELKWDSSADTEYYSLWRTTLYEDGVGGTYPLWTVLLDDTVAKTSYTDKTPTDGRIYSYHIKAINSAGISSSSKSVAAKPMPLPPQEAPSNVKFKWRNTRQGQVLDISWNPVAGASGYVIYRSDNPNGPFKWPENFITTVPCEFYTDHNSNKKTRKPQPLHLDPTKQYYYKITAVNVGGISPSVIIKSEPKSK